MFITILLTVYVLFVIAEFIRALYWQKQVKKQQIRADFRHTEMLEAWTKVEIAIEKLKVNEIEYNSIKRHIRALLEAIERNK